MWLVIILLIIILGIIISLLQGAGESQRAIEVSHLLSKLEAARASGNEDELRRIAREIRDFLDENNLRGGIFDRARSAISDLLK
ncbi:hypothetical protein [Daejeonella oryzae]|uniref:hypothetical protein n=1 Tax=Daejeonella oryzae TaxID=1122943 RepID=UPI00040F3563|nr:hypothetical protein [Daejeonella oryzae]